MRHPLRRLAALAAAAALLPLAAVAAPNSAPAPAKAQAQAQHQTWFTDPPSSVTFTNYYWYVMLASQYYFTVTLPADAWARLRAARHGV